MLGQRRPVSGQIAELLKPTPADVVILKPRQSAFYGTALDILLAQMRTRLFVVAGVATDICVQLTLTAMDANLRGYKLWIPSDCTASESASLKTGVAPVHEAGPEGAPNARRPSADPDRGS